MKVRGVRQRFIVALAAAFVLAAVSWVIANSVRWTIGTRSFAEQGAEFLSRRLFADESTRMTIGSVEGGGWSELTVRDVVIEVRDGSVWAPWLEVGTLVARYDLRELIEDGHKIRSVRVDDLQLHLPRAYEPKPRFASHGDADAAQPVTDDPLLQIDDLLVQGTVGGRDAEPFAAFDCRTTLVVGSGFVGVELVESEIEFGDYPTMHANGPIEIRGETIFLESLHVAGGETRLAVAGALTGRQGARLRVELDPLNLDDVVQATGWELLEPGGWVRGAAQLQGDWSDLMLQLDLNARVGEDRIERVRGSGRLANGALTLTDIDLSLAGVPLSGEGRIAFQRGAESWGRVRFRDVALASFPFLRSQSWLPDGLLTGAVRIGSANPRTGERPFTLEVDDGQLQGFVLEPGRFSGSLGAGGVVTLETVDVVTRGARITGGGTIDPEAGLNLTHDIAVNDLGAFGSMLGEERLSGAGRLRVALIGPFSAPAFSVSGRLDSVVSGPVQLADVDVTLGPGILSRDFTTDLEMSASGGRLGERAIEGLTLSGNVRNDRLRIGSLALEIGGAALELRGRVDWGRGNPVFRVDQLLAALGEQTWRTTAPFSGRAFEGVWSVEPVSLASTVGVLRGKGAFDSRSRSFEVSLTGEQLDLTQVDAAIRGSRLSGNVDFQIDAHGPVGAPAIDFELRASALGAQAFAVDSLSVSLHAEGEGLIIEHIGVDQGGHVDITGSVGFAEPLSASLVRRLATRAGWDDARLDLRAVSDGAEVGAWHGLSDTVDRLRGVSAFDAWFTGSPAAPSGSVALGSPMLWLDDERFSDVDAGVTLHSGWLSVAQLGMTVREASVEARGDLPVRFSLMYPTELDPEAPIDLTIALEPGNLALSSFITDKIIDTEGKVEGVFRIAGSIASPEYTGKLLVSDASLRVTGNEVVVEDVSAAVVLTPEEIRFENVRASSGDDGRVTGTGAFFLANGRADGFDFDLEFEEFPVRSTGEYLAEISGDLRWRQDRGYPKPLAVVDASLRIERLDWLREIVGGQSGGQSVSSWTGRIALDIPRALWIRNQDLEVELKGDLTYERSATSATLLGELEVMRGTYGLFGQTFRIKEGDVRFVDPERIDPDLTVVAETRTPEGRLRVIITGRASDRRIVLESDDADVDQAALWAMLVPTDSSEMSNLVAMTPFIRDLEHRISQEIPGLSVSLEMTNPESREAGGVGARVGTYLGPEVFVSGYQGFTSTVDQEVRVEYQLSDLFFVIGEAERRGLREGSERDIQEEYNINFNFRYEF